MNITSLHNNYIDIATLTIEQKKELFETITKNYGYKPFDKQTYTYEVLYFFDNIIYGKDRIPYEDEIISLELGVEMVFIINDKIPPERYFIKKCHNIS